MPAPHDGVGGRMSLSQHRGWCLNWRNEIIPPPSRRDHCCTRCRAGTWKVAKVRGQVVAILGCWPQRNVVASVQIRKRIMASLRATATAAFLEPLRAARRTPQLLSDEKRLTRASTTYAA